MGKYIVEKIEGKQRIMSWETGDMDVCLLKYKGKTLPTDEVLHYHKKSTELYIVTAGEGVLYVEGIRHVIRKDDLYKVKPGEVHAIIKVNPLAGIEFFCIKTPNIIDDKVVVGSIDEILEAGAIVEIEAITEAPQSDETDLFF